jgi:hypothetical protein
MKHEGVDLTREIQTRGDSAMDFADASPPGDRPAQLYDQNEPTRKWTIDARL